MYSFYKSAKPIRLYFFMSGNITFCPFKFGFNHNIA